MTHAPLNNSSAASKICSIEQIITLRENARRIGERVVQCHGCFDIVHPGHIRHLQHARTLGERLIVSITADEFIDKGTSRPLFAERLRAENLAALSCVDWVVVSPSPTAESLLSNTRPDVYVKGAEYEHNNDPRFAAERDTVERGGGRVVFSSGETVFSSSAIIDAMSDHGAFGGTDRPDPRAIALTGLMHAWDLSPERIAGALERIRGARVLVIGETIVDTYVDCAWPEVTSESPILSLRPGKRRSFDGGAAVIAAHLAALGARVTLVTPIPIDRMRDRFGSALRDRLEARGITVTPILYEGRLPEKERLLVGRDKVAKLDHTQPIELDHRTRNRLIGLAGDFAGESDAAIVTDYGLGMFGPKLTADLFGTLRPRVGFLAGDVSGPRSTLLQMRDADWLTPSERELRAVVPGRPESLPAVTLELIEQTNARRVALTMAEEGVVIFRSHGSDASGSPDGQPVRLASRHIPSLNPMPIDTLGCGDAFLALSSVAQATGVEAEPAAYLGSLAAAACAGSLGNAPCDPAAILSLARRIHAGAATGAGSLPSPV